MSRLLTTGVIAARRRDPLAAIPGCIFAYESWKSQILNSSDDPVEEDDPVAKIVDLSPAGNDLINEFSNRPLWKGGQLNGYGAIRSDPSVVDQTLYWLSAIPAKTVVAVVRVLADGFLVGLIGNHTADFGIRRYSSTQWRDTLNSSDGGDMTNSGQMRINGEVSDTQPLNSWGILTATTTSEIGVTRIFGYFSGRYIEADLAALRIYDRVLDSGEIELIESVYSETTGISLA